MILQLLENKALSRGISGKSAPTLAEITIRKSQFLSAEVQKQRTIGASPYHNL